MLAITGEVALWYVSGVTDMRYGKYRLFAEVELSGKNPYNGDAYVFLSKDRQTLKIIRFKNHKQLLYDITYEKGYKFLQPVFEGLLRDNDLQNVPVITLRKSPLLLSSFHLPPKRPADGGSDYEGTSCHSPFILLSVDESVDTVKGCGHEAERRMTGSCFSFKCLIVCVYDAK